MPGFQISLGPSPGPTIPDAGPLKYHLPKSWTYQIYVYSYLVPVIYEVKKSRPFILKGKFGPLHVL